MRIKLCLASVFLGVSAMAAYFSYDLKSKGYFESISFIESRMTEGYSLRARIQEVLDIRETYGLLSEDGLDFLRANQDIAVSTVILASDYKARAMRRNAKTGSEFSRHMTEDDFAGLKVIYDNGISKSKLDEKIGIIEYILLLDDLSSIYSKDEINDLEAEFSSLESNPKTMHYHAYRIANIADNNILYSLVIDKLFNPLLSDF